MLELKPPSPVANPGDRRREIDVMVCYGCCISTLLSCQTQFLQTQDGAAVSGKRRLAVRLNTDIAIASSIIYNFGPDELMNLLLIICTAGRGRGERQVAAGEEPAARPFADA